MIKCLILQNSIDQNEKSQHTFLMQPYNFVLLVVTEWVMEAKNKV